MHVKKVDQKSKQEAAPKATVGAMTPMVKPPLVEPPPPKKNHSTQKLEQFILKRRLRILSASQWFGWCPIREIYGIYAVISDIVLISSVCFTHFVAWLICLIEAFGGKESP